MAYQLNRLRVIVADDNRYMRTIVKMMLRAVEITLVEEALDGQEAFHKAQKFLPDLVITDWLMQPQDGIELTKLLRNDPASPNPFIPIIMMTGYSQRQRILGAREAGATEILVKPFAPDALYARITEVIEHPRQFIRTASFFGPDRRRHSSFDYSGPERRTGSQGNGQKNSHSLSEATAKIRALADAAD